MDREVICDSWETKTANSEQTYTQHPIKISLLTHVFSESALWALSQISYKLHTYKLLIYNICQKVATDAGFFPSQLCSPFRFCFDSSEPPWRPQTCTYECVPTSSDHLLDPIVGEVGCQPHARDYGRHQEWRGEKDSVKEVHGELRKSVRAEQHEKTHCRHWHWALVRMGDASNSAWLISCSSSVSSSSHLRGHACAPSSTWNTPP